ncbi:MAG: glycosyltransferase family 9 protein [Bacteroidia bacterium]
MLKKKILVLRFSSIGDIVLTTPVIRCLKQQLPHAEIHLLSKPQYKDFLVSNPYIDQVHYLDKHPILKAIELKKWGFDYVVDLHNNLRTSMIKAVLDVPSESFPKLNIEKFQSVHLKINTLAPIHIVSRYFKAAENLGIVDDQKGLDYFITESDIQSAQVHLSHLNNHFIAWAIGGQHATKQLPVQKIIDIAKLIQFPIVLLGGKEDAHMAEQIKKEIPSCINLCGHFSLNQSAACLYLANLVLSNDTGLMHIAAAFQKPIISFWGNTVPELGMYPYYGGEENKAFIVETKNLPCRPCSKIGFDKCPHNHFKCMNEINPQEVFHLIKAALSL